MEDQDTAVQEGFMKESGNDLELSCLVCKFSFNFLQIYPDVWSFKSQIIDKAPKEDKVVQCPQTSPARTLLTIQR